MIIKSQVKPISTNQQIVDKSDLRNASITPALGGTRNPGIAAACC
ncbi:MAG: hypothetical protein P8J33_12000 [Pirellulaceae bacterium]|nr:hypothetical protein [Pirellulaceae bacterium]